MVKIEVPRVSLRSSRLLFYCRIYPLDGQELYPANLNQSRIGEFAAPEFQGSSGKPRRREAEPWIIPHVFVCYLMPRLELCASQSNGSTSFYRRKRGKVRSAPPHHVGVLQAFSSSYQGGSGLRLLEDSERVLVACKSVLLRLPCCICTLCLRKPPQLPMQPAKSSHPFPNQNNYQLIDVPILSQFQKSGAPR